MVQPVFVGPAYFCTGHLTVDSDQVAQSTEQVVSDFTFLSI